eukprot:c17241_g1_i1 orf=285-980(-)
MGEIAKISSPKSLKNAEFGISDDNPRVLSVLSSLLQKMVTENDRIVSGQGVDSSDSSSQCHENMMQRLTVFHGQRAPSISVEQYVERIFKYANCSPSCFVVAYAYLDRFIHQQPDIPITSLNVHRLLITSVMVAAKFLDDSYYNNAYYGKVGGVSTQEMNRLELEFLFRLGFRLHVTLQVFDNYCSHLERELAGYKLPKALLHQVPEEPSVKPNKPSYTLPLSNTILESVS